MIIFGVSRVVLIFSFCSSPSSKAVALYCAYVKILEGWVEVCRRSSLKEFVREGRLLYADGSIDIAHLSLYITLSV